MSRCFGLCQNKKFNPLLFVQQGCLETFRERQFENMMMFRAYGGCPLAIILSDLLTIKVDDDPLLLRILVTVLPRIAMQLESKGHLSKLMDQATGPHTGRFFAPD
jgi:hypothetical protein